MFSKISEATTKVDIIVEPQIRELLKTIYFKIDWVGVIGMDLNPL